MDLKLYSWGAIIGFSIFLVGCFTKNEVLSLLGIGAIMLCVPFNINDNIGN